MRREAYNCCWSAAHRRKYCHRTNDEMRGVCSVFCSDVASGLRSTTPTQYESVAAIRDLRGGRQGARRYIWPG